MGAKNHHSGVLQNCDVNLLMAFRGGKSFSGLYHDRRYVDMLLHEEVVTSVASTEVQEDPFSS